MPLNYTYGYNESNALHSRLPHPRSDTQHPLRLQAIQPYLQPATVENSLVTGISSNTSQEFYSFALFLTVSVDRNTSATQAVRDLLTQQVLSSFTAEQSQIPIDFQIKKLKSIDECHFLDKSPPTIGTNEIPDLLKNLPNLWLITGTGEPGQPSRIPASVRSGQQTAPVVRRFIKYRSEQ